MWEVDTTDILFIFWAAEIHSVIIPRSVAVLLLPCIDSSTPSEYVLGVSVENTEYSGATLYSEDTVRSTSFVNNCHSFALLASADEPLLLGS